MFARGGSQGKTISAFASPGEGETAQREPRLSLYCLTKIS